MLIKKLAKNLFVKYRNGFLINNNILRTKMKLTFDEKLKGMTHLNKELFKVKSQVPVIKVKKVDYFQIKKLLKAYILDSINLKRYQDLDLNDPLSSTHRYLILDPELFDINKLDESIKIELSKLDTNGSEKFVEILPIEINYDDLKFDDIMKAILPDSLLNDNVSVKGYSIIGHIAHFNLRDEIIGYKNIIGEVLLDKINHIKTVVNKVNEIDNTYRNFAFEILAGDKNTMVKCKENGCEFKFDFANVYWNPRLSTEHERIVNLLTSNDVLYDVFAGVGPFSVPAISNKRLVSVLANDLNPNSYKFLLENYKFNNKSKNKIKEQEFRRLLVKKSNIPESILNSEKFKFDPSESFQAFNLDGREFIKTKLKYHLIEMLNYRFVNKFESESNYYVLMNLPALSVEFLDSFVDLYDTNEIELINKNLDKSIIKNFNLNIYCYHFCKGDKSELLKIQQRIKNDIYTDDNLYIDSKFVRKVAPNKDMYCTMFKIGFKHFFTKQKNGQKNKLDNQDENESEKKIPKIE